MDASESRKKRSSSSKSDPNPIAQNAQNAPNGPTMNALAILGAEDLALGPKEKSLGFGLGKASAMTNTKRALKSTTSSHAEQENAKTLAVSAAGASVASASPLLPLNQVLAGVVLYISKPLAHRQAEIVNLGEHLNSIE